MGEMESRALVLQLNIDNARLDQRQAIATGRDSDAAIHGLSVMAGEIAKSIHDVAIAIAFK